jgi:branched-chain amino acid transport system ATP-binding protein
MNLLETRNLKKRFGNIVAVNNVNLSVEEGTTHSVIGPNGAGKSTLFNLITGLYDPTSGTVEFAGEDITGWSPHEIARRGVARSFQTSDVFLGLTVAENIRIAAQAVEKNRDSIIRRADSLTGVTERAQEILTDVGLGRYADDHASSLSHGDRRKLEIAITAVNDPELLLLDEPAAGMGKEEGTETVETVRRLASERGITLIMIEHDIEIVMSISDIVTVLQKGQIIAEGPPEAISDDERVRQAYLGGVKR